MLNNKLDRSFSDVYAKTKQARSLILNNNKGDVIMPKTITFQVTESCNLNCSYCYQINKSSNAMNIESAKKFIDLLIADSYREDSYVYIKDTLCVIIEFIGGEPLLEIDLMNDIVEYFKFKTISEGHPWATQYMISISSNGVNYFNEKVQNFLDKNKHKLDFGMSLDGCKELHDSCRVFYNGEGSYDIVVAACKDYLKNHNEYMSTKLTIAPENVEWVYKAMVNLHSNIGYSIIHANCIYEKGWNIDHAKELYNQMKQVADYIIDNELHKKVSISLFEEELFKPQSEIDNNNYCGTTGHMLALNPSGQIFSCLRFMSSSLGDEVDAYSIGDIENGIGRNPNHIKRINILNSITRRSQSTDECFSCPIATGCGWCTAYNYQETGTPDKRVTYTCGMHKARALANVYYWNKLYKKIDNDDIFKMHIPKEWALEIISEDEYNMLLELSK
ncbi:MAG: radical SAM peptide maturase, CXXX-repeat target family [Paraclostridium sp.]